MLSFHVKLLLKYFKNCFGSLFQKERKKKLCDLQSDFIMRLNSLASHTLFPSEEKKETLSFENCFPHTSQAHLSIGAFSTSGE